MTQSCPLFFVVPPVTRPVRQLPRQPQKRKTAARFLRPPVFDFIQSQTASSDQPSALASSCLACPSEWISAGSRQGWHGRFPERAKSAGSSWRQMQGLCRWPRPDRQCSDMFLNRSAPASGRPAPDSSPEDRFHAYRSPEKSPVCVRNGSEMGDCHQNISSGDFYVVNKEFSCQIIRVTLSLNFPFRFFDRFEKMAGEFFPATLWEVQIQRILSSASRCFH